MSWLYDTDEKTPTHKIYHLQKGPNGSVGYETRSNPERLNKGWSAKYHLLKRRNSRKQHTVTRELALKTNKLRCVTGDRHVFYTVL